MRPPIGCTMQPFWKPMTEARDGIAWLAKPRLRLAVAIPLTDVSQQEERCLGVPAVALKVLGMLIPHAFRHLPCAIQQIAARSKVV